MQQFSLSFLTNQTVAHPAGWKERMPSQWCNEVSFTSHSTHNRSFRRRAFPGNQLHWHWQPKTRNRINTCTKVNSAFHPSRVSKWVPASAGKAKAGMVHSVSEWTQGDGVCR